MSKMGLDTRMNFRITGCVLISDPQPQHAFVYALIIEGSHPTDQFCNICEPGIAPYLKENDSYAGGYIIMRRFLFWLDNATPPDNCAAG